MSEPANTLAMRGMIRAVECCSKLRSHGSPPEPADVLQLWRAASHLELRRKCRSDQEGFAEGAVFWQCGVRRWNAFGPKSCDSEAEVLHITFTPPSITADCHQSRTALLPKLLSDQLPKHENYDQV